MTNYKNRPTIPAEVQRAIFVEAGHRCACCGVAFPLERAHIVPWRESQDHSKENLLCLCANCHQMADHDWDSKTFFAYKSQPWVNRQFRVVKDSDTTRHKKQFAGEFVERLRNIKSAAYPETWSPDAAFAFRESIEHVTRMLQIESAWVRQFEAAYTYQRALNHLAQVLSAEQPREQHVRDVEISTNAYLDEVDNMIVVFERVLAGE